MAATKTRAKAVPVAPVEAAESEPITPEPQQPKWALYYSTRHYRPRENWSCVETMRQPILFDTEQAALDFGQKLSLRGVSDFFYEAREETA